MIKLKNPGEGVIGMDHEKLMRILTNSEFVDEDYLLGAINRGFDGRKLLRLMCRKIAENHATSPWIKVSGQEPGNFMK